MFEEERKDPTKNVHWTNAIDLFGPQVMGSKKHYDLGKKCGHAADYLVTPRELAAQAGILVSEAEKFMARWFYLNPEILKWHEAVAREVNETRQVKNVFGYRRYFFGRLEDVLPEAVAWKPQSTVGLVINHALCNIAENLSWIIQILLQVHDSLVTQAPTERIAEAIPLQEKESLIEIPYPTPLIIPVGFKTSEKSWGDVKDFVRT